MTLDENFERLIRPFELLDQNVSSASCHIHIYKRINALTDQIKVEGKDAEALIAVRAGSITAALVSLMASLDTYETRYRDRASIGGLLHRLETLEYREYFVRYHGTQDGYDAACNALKNSFHSFRLSDDFKKAKKLRNNNVAHILDVNDTPTVTYECLDNVFYNVRTMCDLAFLALGCGKASYVHSEDRHKATADCFISTYLRGMQSSA